MANETQSDFEKTCAWLGASFESITKARRQAMVVYQKLVQIADNGIDDANNSVVSVIPPDTSIVVFGSLARAEWTSGSDIDWTLLVDGPADPHHHQAAREFKHRVEKSNLTAPGPTGVFGNPSFSHELIHCIGGEDDTNTNLTRRILLLLESKSLSKVDAHSRVIRGILQRYLESERSFLADTGRRYKVPRFLLNDFVRYWRTVAVDYVNKQWERGDDKWALRNIKLRFSRKLLFVSGLLVTFSCYLTEHEGSEHSLFKDEAEARRRVFQHIAELIHTTPIDLLCRHCQKHSTQNSARLILSAYDKFLSRLDDPDSRDRLNKLKLHEAYSDSLFEELRQCSHEFQDGLNQMFYQDSDQLKELMLKYGVF